MCEAGIATPLLLHCQPAQAVAPASAAAAATTIALPDAIALQKRYTAPCLALLLVNVDGRHGSRTLGEI